MPWLLQSLFWVPVRLFYKIFYRLKVEGLAHLNEVPKSAGVILVSNHRSQLDPSILAVSLPFFSRRRPLSFVSLAPKYYAHIPIGRHLYGGVLFRLFGAYPAARGTGDYRLAFAPHLELLSRGKTVSIFPEGGISRPGSPKPVRPGVAHLAALSGAWILPARIRYGEAGARVTFGAPFVSSGMDAQAIMEKVHAL